jgi:hypothetical protein
MCTTFVAVLQKLFVRALRCKELEVVAGTVAVATGAYHMTRPVRIDCLGSAQRPQFVQPTFLHVRTDSSETKPRA